MGEDNYKYNVCFGSKIIKEAVRYILNNCYFIIGDEVFTQIIGITLRPFSLILLRKQTELRKESFAIILDSSMIFLNILTGCGEFEEYIPEMYHSELDLNKDNFVPTEASFSDKFTFSLYNKRDAFPFTIVRMPHASSTIPSSVFYSSIGAKVLRISRASSEGISF